ncbi:5'-nucleotidase domain-containing protein [Beauveria bassiana ARSEF 2860]|uniref:5'-nucleotidase domain-containing protein n=1 Tax=Beauveria bassiana (strain ARSEF 2860) TaxID=655819 RepID=J4WJN8_BEAB2|nr:5'-nucleotidase domain-containing protein [Beauveria bassiana ARSEF 2860]EJP70020.1 5'-nucleotidase domain-containing protein [Beauveria bassiana ARSEF 2860]
MKIAAILVTLGVASCAVAEDVLYSRRHLSKRFIDSDGNYNMTFIHVNDVHAHLDEFAKSGSDCTDPSKGCFGGYARIKTKVEELRKTYPDHLLLNAGDEFQGTLFFSYYGGEKIADTINNLNFDVMTLGNHEWDNGDEELGKFLKNLTFPIVACNVKSENEALNKTVKNYHIFDKHKLAIIGATTETTKGISNVGNGTNFLDVTTEVQKAIWEIRNTTDIRRIVALTHIGYEEDQKLAKDTEGLSLIVGGHSHTLVGDMPNAAGKYPTIVEDKSGNEVFIVTSYRWGEYLGSIDLTFDKQGRALSYHGAPIHMTNTTKFDKSLQNKVLAWRKPFEEFSNEVIGTTKNELDQTNCQKEDCLLGQVMTDAMLDYRRNISKNAGDELAEFAFMNAGGIRATIGPGNITRGAILTSFPFGNAIVQLPYSGKDLRKMIEGWVSRESQFSKKKTTSWFQISKNIKIQYNPDNDSGSKLISVSVGDKPLDDDRQDYRVVTLDFVARGGDNLVEPTTGSAALDTNSDIFEAYVKANTPLTNELEKRVVKTDKKTPDSTLTTGDNNATSTSKAGSGSSSTGDAKGSRSAASSLDMAIIFAFVVAAVVSLVM